MNDFSKLERELKRLQPVKPSATLVDRIEQALARGSEIPANVIAPRRFTINWVGLGLGLAAAAAFLILARIDFRPAARTHSQVATAVPESTAPLSNFVPAAVTRVVYNTRDEGLVFPGGEARPARRVRTAQRETLQWRDPRSGASLRVSYPTEEVTLIPVSGQ
jgi:hypothetical protein